MMFPSQLKAKGSNSMKTRSALFSLILAASFFLTVYSSEAQEGQEKVYQGKTVLEWIQRLDSPDKFARSGAVYALEYIAKEDERAVKGLSLALNDKNWGIRQRAAEALGRLRSKAAPATSALILSIKDNKSLVKSAATLALGSIGRKAAKAVPALIKALHAKDSGVNWEAADALGKIGKPTDNIVPALIKSLKTKNSWMTKRSAIISLGMIGPEAKQALPTILKIAQVEQAKLQSWSATTLGRLGVKSDQVIAALNQLLKHKNWATPLAALGALGRLGHQPDKMADTLIQKTIDRNNNSNIRASSVEALGEIGLQSKKAIPAIITALKDKDSFVRKYAAISLGRLGRDGKAAIPALRFALNDKDKEVQAAAESSLKLIMNAKKPRKKKK